jgi:hypothetical protein
MTPADWEILAAIVVAWIVISIQRRRVGTSQVQFSRVIESLLVRCGGTAAVGALNPTTAGRLARFADAGLDEPRSKANPVAFRLR